MTVYIRGFIQLKALFWIVENFWIFLIGRDTRNLDAWDIKYCIYSGRGFMKDRLKSIKRELEIFSGFAKPYAVYTTPLFNKHYSELFGDAALVDFLYKQDLRNEQIES